jgi:hypothetical protein
MRIKKCLKCIYQALYLSNTYLQKNLSHILSINFLIVLLLNIDIKVHISKDRHHIKH